MSDRWHPPPRRIESGEWPEFETALAAVNRDVAATLPDQQPLVLMLSPSGDVGELPDRLYVALADGRWQGNAVHAWGVDECDAAEPDGPFTVLSLVAEAAREVAQEFPAAARGARSAVAGRARRARCTGSGGGAHARSLRAMAAP